MFPVDEDVADLPRAFRGYEPDLAGEESVGGAPTELEIRGRSDPQDIPVDVPATGGSFPKGVQGPVTFPQQAEGIPRARGPLAEEDLRPLPRGPRSRAARG